MLNRLEEVHQLYDKTVPKGEEVFMVIKAHLIIESALIEFVKARTVDADEFHNQIFDGNSPCRNGLGLVLLAQGLSIRDEIPQTHAEIIWPSLKLLNSIRNRLVHELSPDHTKIRAQMRKFCDSVFPEGIWNHESDVNKAFYKSAGLLLSLLHIDRHPLWVEDTI
ncbi:MAG: hypothetical protein M9960_01055 [Xanthomonadaceae bacterium]|nr:hypothetical protein [Xanthomonadaceae bacterium]